MPWLLSNSLVKLGKHFRTIAHSRRYHWPNDPILAGADYSMTQHLDDLQQLVASLGAAPCHVAGHSYGALIALMLALRVPQLIRALVLSETPAITLFVSDLPKPREILKLLMTRPRTAAAILTFAVRGLDPATAAVRRDDIDEAMRRIGRITLGAKAFRRTPEARLGQVRANAIRAEFLGSRFPPLDPEAVRSVRIPTLLVTGQRSPALFHRLAGRLEELLPAASRIVIPAASHIVHEDYAPAYNRAVLSFLSNLPLLTF